MNLFLLGFSNSGKTTIFNIISKKHQNPSHVFTKDIEPIISSAIVYDEKVDLIHNLFPQKEKKYTQIQIVDYMGVMNDLKHNRKVFDLALKSQILIFVIRNFVNPEIPSPNIEINPLKEFKLLYQEILLSDLQIIETRLKTIKEMEKKGKKAEPKEKEFLEKFKIAIENGERYLNIKEERKKFSHLSFLSWLPIYVLINSEPQNNEQERCLTEFLKEEKIPFSVVFGKIEEEADELGEEGKEWLISYGIEKSFKTWFLKNLLNMLGYISFITIGDKEIKSWFVEEGTNAYEAAGKIHTDIQKGFIKTEVLSFDELLQYKDFHIAREKGVLKFEGKNYKIKDGDVIYFRFHYF